MSDIINTLEVVFYVWTFYMVTKILWKLLMGIKGHIWCTFEPNRVNLLANYGSWAVITGSSDGIGKEYSKQLAKRGLNVVLISRTLKKLENVASEIERQYNVKTKIIEADFSKGETVYEHIKTELKDIPVGILVNNVGTVFEYPNYFTLITSQEIWNLVKVNVGATLFMTRMILPQMLRRGKGAIVNVSSGSEIIPLPLSCVYSASKAFMKNFTEALRFECKKHGITVQLISPYVVNTNLISFSDWLQSSVPTSIRPETCAESAVNSLGVLDHSAGYWVHELLYLLIASLPEWLRITFAGLLGQTLRKEYLRNKKKIQNEKVQ